MKARHNRPLRRGTILPLLALGMTSLMAMIALGIDLGVVAVARTQCQNAADAAALAGVRQLNGVATDNNRPTALTTANTIATSNKIVNQTITSSQVTATAGTYTYNSGTQIWSTDFSGSKASTTPWSGMQVQITATQQTYFAQVFGLGPFSIGAIAQAVHRPRDLAMVLDFSTSMQYSCNTNIRGTTNGGPTNGSMSPDTVFPQFGPWSVYSTTTANAMMATSNYADRGGEAHAVSNLTVANSNGPPLIGDFLYDQGGGTYVNAFVGPSADAGGYANTSGTYSATQTPVVTPTPNAWAIHPAAGLDGDLWPFKKGKNPSSPAVTDWASTVQELLTGSNSTWSNSTNASTGTKSWDVSGYDYDPVTKGLKSGYSSSNPATSTFKGYTLGPGYYGKTFYIWPPDPRTPVSTPGNSSYVPGDWRRRYFRTSDNSVLWDSSGNWITNGSTINYNNVLAWIKSGPQTLPGNLQSGRIVYYSSIPDTIPSSGLSLDQVFWKEYIDFVLGYGRNDQNTTLYGRSAGNSSNGTSFGATVQITPQSSLTGSPQPYMNYNDVPIHPRLHFWFGPLTMLAFLTGPPEYARNWLPGTSHEAHAWHLKAGMQSAISDLQKNHPNDTCMMVYFSTLGAYNTPRVPLGQNYKYLTNVLWYPYSLINSTDGSVSGTMRPYDTNFNDKSRGVIPNSNGGTNPTGGFMTAYNEFATNGRKGASKVVIYETDGVAHDYYDPANYSGGLFTFGSQVDEAVSTDVTMASKTNSVVLAGILCQPTKSPKAYTYTTPDFSVSIPATPGFSTARSPVRIHSLGFGELFEPSVTSETTATGNPAKDMQETAMKVILYVQTISGTSKSNDTIQTCWGYPGTATGSGGTGGYTSGTQSFKIIVGDYNTRINLIQQALQRILQSGVQVSLVE